MSRSVPVLVSNQVNEHLFYFPECWPTEETSVKQKIKAHPQQVATGHQAILLHALHSKTTFKFNGTEIHDSKAYCITLFFVHAAIS